MRKTVLIRKWCGIACNKCHFVHSMQLVRKRIDCLVETLVESKHAGVRYPCMKCDYVTSWENHLKAHIESIHEGASYSCDQCNHMARTGAEIKNHIKIRQELGWSILVKNVNMQQQK